jgi:hypothetical protein
VNQLENVSDAGSGAVLFLSHFVEAVYVSIKKAVCIKDSTTGTLS